MERKTGARSSLRDRAMSLSPMHICERRQKRALGYIAAAYSLQVNHLGRQALGELGGNISPELERSMRGHQAKAIDHLIEGGFIKLGDVKLVPFYPQTDKH